MNTGASGNHSAILNLAGPGIVVMVADNDAGGITTYAATGAKIRLQSYMVFAFADSCCVFCAGNDSKAWSSYKKRACGIGF